MVLGPSKKKEKAGNSGLIMVMGAPAKSLDALLAGDEPEAKAAPEPEVKEGE